MRSAKPSPTRQGRLLAVLLSCVLLAQWLALAHSVLHPGGHAAERAQLDAPGLSLARLVQALDSGHAAGSADCLALDQLCHGAPGALPPALALAAPRVQPATATPQSATAQPQWRPQLARAPPVPV